MNNRERMVAFANCMVDMPSTAHPVLVSIYNSMCTPLARNLRAEGNHAWCALFASVCLRIGGLPYAELSAGNLLRQMPESWHVPTPETARPGDLLFYDYDHNGNPDHVGVITEVNPDGTITTVEGNVNGKMYRRKDALGYCRSKDYDWDIMGVEYQTGENICTGCSAHVLAEAVRNSVLPYV